jgi:predicted nucleic acid-binding protein
MSDLLGIAINLVDEDSTGMFYSDAMDKLPDESRFILTNELLIDAILIQMRLAVVKHDKKDFEYIQQFIQNLQNAFVDVDVEFFDINSVDGER